MLNNALIAMPTTTDASGTASFPLDLTSADPVFVGVSLYAQWAAVSANTTLGLAFSDGLQVLLER